MQLQEKVLDEIMIILYVNLVILYYLCQKSMENIESLDSCTQFQRHSVQVKDDKQNYQYNCGCFSRYSIYLHSLINMKQLKKNIKKNKLSANPQQSPFNPRLNNFIELQDIPNLKKQDQSQKLNQIIEENLGRIINQKVVQNKENQKIQENNLGKNLTWKDLFKLSFQIRKPQCILIFILVFLELVVTRLAFSIFVQFLFQALLDNNINQAYLYGGICSFCYFLYTLCYNTSQYLVLSVSAAVRYGLINLIIKKIMSLPQYSVKKAQIGKLMNIISNDLNMVEDKIGYLPKMFIMPFFMVGINALIIIRYGWQGALGGVFFLILFILAYIQTVVTSSILGEINLLKDRRVKYITQIVSGIKFIKIYAWENAFQKMINFLRDLQIKKYYSFSFWKGIQRGLGSSAGNLASYIIILTMSLTIPQKLTTPKIFAILQLFLFYRVTLVEIAVAFMCFQQTILIFNRYVSILNIQPQNMIQIQPDRCANVSINERLQQNAGQRHDKHTIRKSDEKLMNLGSISLTQANLLDNDNIENNQFLFKQFNALWNLDQGPVLKNINFKIKKQTFVGIAGKIGSGKSSLILAMIQQIPYFSGQFYGKGSVAYVEQSPVIFSATIKENILFGKKYNSYFYNLALTVSCFDHDLKNMPNGEETLVGQKGITLSGGQKARLALARAINADADILILDDPFSAVDSKVGKNIYQNLMTKIKGLKTIVLATHHVQYFEDCDEIIYLKGGQILEKGNYEQLKSRLITGQQIKIESRNSMKSKISIEKSDKIAKQVEATISFYKQENVQVNWRTYWRFIFFAKINIFLFPLAVTFFLLAELANIFAFRFLASYDLHKAKLYQFFNGDDTIYWTAIGVLFGTYFILSIIKFTLLYVVILNSNKSIHAQMVKKVMRSPISYFDYTPSGQIINKFSNDIGIMDYALAFNIVNSFQGLVVTVALPINIYQVNILFIIPGILLMIFVISFFMYIKEVIVETKQLDLRQKSPLFSQLGESIDGLIQQKAYGMLDRTKQKFETLIDSSNRANFTFSLMNKIFVTYVLYFGVLSLIGIIFIGINSSTGTKAGLYAMSVIFMIQIIDYFGFFLKQVLNMESNMVSVARGFLVIDLQSEEQFYQPYDQQLGILDVSEEHKISQNITQNWPKNPKIHIKNLSMRYRQDLPLTLKAANLQIKQGQKFGIIGRTGAGKSSIIQSLLRLTEPEKGSQIRIDDADALKMGLHSLRRHISVIPQNSFFFKDTIRRNLDPFQLHSEEQISQALKDSNLSAIVEKLPEGLNTNIASISSIFSQGEQQLLSLARVLLQNNKILILDEATSSVDNQTDTFIQNKIKQKFQSATVITIAHRLLTIAGYDKVAVLNKGQIVEYGAPYELILKEGQFYEMVSHSGNSMQKIIEIAKDSYMASSGNN